MVCGLRDSLVDQGRDMKGSHLTFCIILKLIHTQNVHTSYFSIIVLCVTLVDVVKVIKPSSSPPASCPPPSPMMDYSRIKETKLKNAKVGKRVEP